jgi:hypothetical protein
LGISVDDRIAQKVEDVSEEILFRTYKRAETTTTILIQKSDENITKMCAVMLYQVVLGLFDDYYNVRKGRDRMAWEKELRDHISLLRKVSEILVFYNIVSRNEIEDFVFEDTLSDDVDFPRVATVASGLLTALHEFDTMAIFKH